MKTWHIFLALFVNALAIHDFQDLRQPTEIISQNGALNFTFTVDVFRYIGQVNYTTRAYYYHGVGSIPGPTWRVKAGDTITFTLKNALPPGQSTEYEHNTMHSPDTTNMHTHGLHVDPYEDDVFIEVHPEEQHVYTYVLPDNHAPGMHWYHAHHHGATAFQVIGGLAGAIIVDPVDDSIIPPELSNMDEIVMILQHMKFDSDPGNGCPNSENFVNAFRPYSYLEISDEIGDTLDVNPSLANTSLADFYVVNGQYQPRIQMRPGEKKVFRLLHAAGTHTLEIEIPGCNIYRISRDGVYRSEPTDAVDVIVLIQASRADIIVDCPRPGTFNLKSTIDPSRDNIVSSNVLRYFQDPILTIEVSGDELIMPLPSQLPPLPSYLSDLQNVSRQDIAGQYRVDFGQLRGPETCNFGINGMLFCGPDVYDHIMTLDTIEEWIIKDAAPESHPFHLHVNHFQVISTTYQDDPNQIVFEIGEWRDTLAARNVTTIRFRTDTFPGVVVLHCHYLRHEDLGMMQVTYIESSPETDTEDHGTGSIGQEAEPNRGGIKHSESIELHESDMNSSGQFKSSTYVFFTTVMIVVLSII
ncbi:laccase-like [Saccoglossus kowalevskii]